MSEANLSLRSCSRDPRTTASATTRRSARASRRSAAALAPFRIAERERGQPQRRRHRRLDEDDLAVPRLEHGAEQVPREGVGECRPGRGSPWSRMSSSATSAGAGCAGQDPIQLATQSPLGGGRSATASDPEPPTTSRRRARSRNRPSAKTMLTDSGVLVSASMETLAPDPRSMTWNTNAPETGSESAETTRQPTVYVPGGAQAADRPPPRFPAAGRRCRRPPARRLRRARAASRARRRRARRTRE